MLRLVLPVGAQSDRTFVEHQVRSQRGAGAAQYWVGDDAIRAPTQASATFSQWDKSLRKVNAGGLFAQVWKPGANREADATRLGIELSDNGEFGLVEVAAVAPSTPAEGRMQPGDRILGVDGRLLEMASPAEDLQEWWEEASPGSSHTLRVLRGESVLELEVTRRHDDASLADLFAQPLDLLRELSLLCEAIPSATLQIHNTGDQHFSALLSLRLGSNE